jgi:hypothetical protein
MQRLKNLICKTISVFQICVKKYSIIWEMEQSNFKISHETIFGEIAESKNQLAITLIT